MRQARSRTRRRDAPVPDRSGRWAGESCRSSRQPRPVRRCWRCAHPISGRRCSGTGPEESRCVLLRSGSAGVVRGTARCPECRHGEPIGRGGSSSGSVRRNDTHLDIAMSRSGRERRSTGPRYGRGRHRGRAPPSESQAASARVCGRSQAVRPRADADRRRLSGGSDGGFSVGGRRTMRMVVTAAAPGRGRACAAGRSARNRGRTRRSRPGAPRRRAPGRAARRRRSPGS